MKKLLLAFILTSVSISVMAEWKYVSSTDRMTDEKSTSAFLYSDNIIKLDFPYQEPQKAILSLHKSYDNSIGVILGLSHGQIDCNKNSVGECELLVRFDEGDAQTWLFREPRPVEGKYISLLSEQGFIRMLGKSKKVLMKIHFFGGGSEILEFSTSGLDLSQIK